MLLEPSTSSCERSIALVLLLTALPTGLCYVVYALLGPYIVLNLLCTLTIPMIPMHWRIFTAAPLGAVIPKQPPSQGDDTAVWARLVCIVKTPNRALFGAVQLIDCCPIRP